MHKQDFGKAERKHLTIVAFIKAPFIFPATAFCLSSAAFLTSRKSICVTLWSGKSSSWCVKNMVNESELNDTEIQYWLYT